MRYRTSTFTTQTNVRLFVMAIQIVHSFPSTKNTMSRVPKLLGIVVTPTKLVL
jgi:hypothetical protein